MSSLTGKLQGYKGCCSIVFSYDIIMELFGDSYISNVPDKSKNSQLLRDNNLFHITVLNSEELKQLSFLDKTIDFENVEEVRLNVIGLGINCNCYYLVVLSRQLDDMRVSLSLPSKDFHITVGFLQNDVHNIPKGLDTIVKWERTSIDELIYLHISSDINKNIKILASAHSKFTDNFKLLKHYINELCKANHLQKALIFSYDLINLSPKNIVSYFVHIKLLDRLSILNESILQEMVHVLLQLENLKQARVVNEVLSILNNYIIDNHDNPSKTIQILYFNTAESSISLQELPRNFSKVQENVFGSGMVSSKHLSLLSQLGINTIVNLIGEERPTVELLQLAEKLNITVHHLGFPDRRACKIEVLIDIVDRILVNRDNRTLVHCRGGVGRTNMILSGLLMKTSNVPPSEAMAILKDKRKLIMTTEQILLLKSYYGHLVCDDQSNATGGSSSKSSSPFSQGLMMMVGLPCAGKSSFCLEMIRSFGSRVIHLNQDELGKSACEDLLSQHAKTDNAIILLDRCNLTVVERKHWLDLYRSVAPRSATITAVFLDLGLDESLKRLKLRKNHLTLQSSGDAIIVSANQKLCAPTKSEGFEQVVNVSSVEELDAFKRQMGINEETNLYEVPQDKIIKFPRTRHIANMGAMARDDLLMDKTDVEMLLSGEVVVEEKVDGANIGFSLAPDGSIRAQNRSHYVHSSSHEQFKKLGFWIQSHLEDLSSLLSRGNFIVYGEWLFAKHSINYTKLPDYFVLFDVFDMDSKTFFSRTAVEEMVRNTSLSLVPVIFRGRVSGVEQLAAMATQTKSQFYDGVVEGVVVRAMNEDSSLLKLRGKIVRSDFISGDQHWNKGKQTVNSLKKF